MRQHDLKLWAAPLAWRLLRSSLRLEPRPAAAELPAGPCIFACLHRDILPTIEFVRPARPVLLVSRSPDGDILIRTLGELDYGFVRGETGSDGARALIGLRRALDDGRAIGIAVDGPRGPFGTINPGVLQLARLTGAPILPLVARAARALILKTWDRTVVPLPFSVVRMELAPPLRLDPQADAAGLGTAREQLAAVLGVGGDGP